MSQLSDLQADNRKMREMLKECCKFVPDIDMLKRINRALSATQTPPAEQPSLCGIDPALPGGDIAKAMAFGAETLKAREQLSVEGVPVTFLKSSEQATAPPPEPAIDFKSIDLDGLKTAYQMLADDFNRQEKKLADAAAERDAANRRANAAETLNSNQRTEIARLQAELNISRGCKPDEYELIRSCERAAQSDLRKSRQRCERMAAAIAKLPPRPGQGWVGNNDAVWDAIDACHAAAVKEPSDET